jgi:hypothetical protein
MRNTIALAALMGLTVAVSSGAIITTIDSFNTTVQGISDPSTAPCAGASNAPTAATADAVGGFRSISAARTSGGGCAAMDTNFSVSGALSTSLPIGATGTFTVVWNAGGAGLLAGDGVDFLAGVSFRGSQDADVPPNEVSTVVFRACQDAAGTVGCVDSSFASIVSQTTADYSTTFASLQQNVAYLRMTIAGGLARDVTIDFVNADVPEPGTFALAAGALVALGLARTRRP